MRRLPRWLVLIAWIACVAAPWTIAADPETPKTVPPESPVPDQAELDKKFEQTMNGATLVGFFTDSNNPKPGALREERYTINSVKKLEGDVWLFTARIQYGGHDVTLPLPLSVKWAGDTPVITLTDLAIPGFGTFTCRVLIYDDQYAGTWRGKTHGGNLFGRIEREKKEEKGK